METKTYRYEDPTGAGNDALLTIPVTWEPPDNLAVRMKNDGTREYMELLGQEDD